MSDLTLTTETEFIGTPVDQFFQSEEDQSLLVSYIQTEFTDITTGEDREKFLKRVQKWRRHRLGQTESETKNQPWENAANICSPTTMSATNTIYAMLKEAFERIKPRFTEEIVSPEFSDAGKALSKLVNKISESPFHINLPKKDRTILYEAESLGTQFVEVPWTIRGTRFVRTSPNGSREEVNKVFYEGPDVLIYRIEDVIIRSYYYDLQKAPMIAFVNWLSVSEIRQYELLGFFNKSEEIPEENQFDLDDNQRAEFSKFGLGTEIPSNADNLRRVLKTYVRWDIDKDGVQEDIIVWIDVDQGVILRAEFNELGSRPIVRIPCLDIPFQLYGVGVGWMAENSQDEIDTCHEIALNSMQLSAHPIIASKTGESVGPNEKFYPMKHIKLTDVERGLRVFNFPDTSNSATLRESIAKNYIDIATGVNEALRGLPDSIAKTRTTVSGQMFQAQRGNIVFNNSILEAVQDAYSEIGMFIVLQLVANAERSRENLLTLLDEDERILVDDLLNLKVEEIGQIFRVTVRLTDTERTEEARRQNLLTLTQLYIMLGEKMFQQLAMAMDPNVQQNPDLFAMCLKFVLGYRELLDEVLKLFKLQDTSKYIPLLENIQKMVEFMEATEKQNQIERQGGMNEPMEPDSFANPVL